MKREQYEEIREKALALYDKAHIVLTQEEKDNLEVADLGLGDIYRTGIEIVVYVNTDRCCGKEMALLPHQTCPEHIHAPIPDLGYIGKEETFRCRYGEVYVYVDRGEPTANPKVQPPQGDEAYYTAQHEIILRPGQQYTMEPNTRHWFQAGPDGAVVSEFSTPSHDELDIFTDPRIQRMPVVED